MFIHARKVCILQTQERRYQPFQPTKIHGLIKFPYIIRGQQHQHALKNEDRCKDRCTVCKRQIHADLVYTWYWHASDFVEEWISHHYIIAVHQVQCVHMHF